MKHKLIFVGLAVLLGFICVGLLVGYTSRQAQASSLLDSWTQVGGDGLGDPDNEQIPTLAEFNGYLYAGTSNYDGISTTAQIWRSATGLEWVKVDERPLDGTVDMLAFKDALYAASANGYIWSSPDGLTWTEVVTDGLAGSIGAIARLAVYDDALYAGTWNEGAEIWRTTDGSHWEPFVEAGLGDLNNNGAIASETFDGLLYWGVSNASTGAQLWRSNGITTTVVMTGGFGVPANEGITALAAFDSQLYAGLFNMTGVQAWRSPNGSDWTKVEFTFDNPNTAGNVSLEVFRDQLYLAVEDDIYGMDVWRTSDGDVWEQVGFNGFGDAYNISAFGDNGMTVFKNKLYVATNNFSTGGEIWRLNPYPIKTFLPCTLNFFSSCPVYTDDFSDPTSGWVQTNNDITTLKYLNGEYQILVKQQYYVVFSYRDFGSSDFRLELDVRPATHLNGAHGLVFNVSDAGFYLFEISEGWYALYRYDDIYQDWTTLINWTQSSALIRGFHTNHLKVVRHDNNIALYANDHLLANYVDGVQKGGGLGMAGDAAQANYDARFDNLEVQTACITGNTNLSSIIPQAEIKIVPHMENSTP